MVDATSTYSDLEVDRADAMTSSAVRRASALSLVVIMSAGVGLSPSLAQEPERPGGLFDMIFGGSERLAGDRGPQLYTSERTAQVGSVQAGAPDVMLRLDRLENQIRQLTGVIEQLQYRNQQLETYVRRMQEDGEGRGAPRSPAQMRPQVVPGVVPGQAAAPGPVAAAPRRGDAFDPSQHPNAPGAPHALGPLAGTAPVPARPGEMADAATGLPAPPRGNPGSMPATLPPSQTPKDEFDLAYGYVLRRDYALAEEGFRNFMSRYPSDRLMGDATFWLGESLFQRQRYRDAAEAFLNVSTKFEGNAKAPDALLRLGQSLAALGEKEAACASLGEVLRKFPRASAGLKQAVEREQKRVRC
jgi:tol-pal system protein YbgF